MDEPAAITIRAETQIPQVGEFTPLLAAYYDGIAAQLRELGGPEFDPAPFIDDFWAHIGDVLPPNGRLYTARDREGRILGQGSLRVAGGGVGEMKRLYVVPEARGLSLGRRLVEARIAAAREMGLRSLNADTWRNNTPMLELYGSLGFERVDLFEDSATYHLMPDLAAYMVFLERVLDPVTFP
ncbi:MAG: GNAT family N-acetyltransferase [Actinomycetota bacterium]